ncbi:MAG TPA: BON domain-containing protein [Acidimicrobiales bacterium]|jgi:hypothetical protein|nr:BON domain-containing protein [Acidimicrobiales bacterium]
MSLIRLVLLPPRVLFGVSKRATKVSYRVGRAVGYRRIVLFGAGAAVGLLVAPVPGRDLRRRLLEGTGLATGDVPPGIAEQELADEVRTHLRQAPRTWHLPQPVVTEVAPGRIRLDGSVSDDTARRDLESTVAQVEGVDEVDNQVRVVGTASTIEPS